METITFTSTRRLKKHQKQHRSQTCKFCGKSFYQTFQLVEHIYTHVKTPLKTTEASVDCQLINLNTMQVENRDRTPKEDSLTTYGIMTPERFEYVVYIQWMYDYYSFNYKLTMIMQCPALGRLNITKPYSCDYQCY